jgi:hypothetical protein
MLYSVCACMSSDVTHYHMCFTDTIWHMMQLFVCMHELLNVFRRKYGVGVFSAKSGKPRKDQVHTYS